MTIHALVSFSSKIYFNLFIIREVSKDSMVEILSSIIISVDKITLPQTASETNTLISFHSKMKTLFIFIIFENVFKKANSLNRENIDNATKVIDFYKMTYNNIQITSKDSRQFK
jgi:hypothetical protein